MNYIYDITLNFNKELYNFYEWNEEDDIEFYLKMPIFKVEEIVLNDFINSNIIISKDFINKIYKKTECYGNKKEHNCAVFSTGKKCIAISFNKNGESEKKSYISIDEEEDILEYSKLLKYSLIEYKIKEKIKMPTFSTREENNVKNEVICSLNRIMNNNESDKLKYIFYEVYNERENDQTKMFNKLYGIIEGNYDKLKKLKTIFDSVEEKS